VYIVTPGRSPKLGGLPSEVRCYLCPVQFVPKPCLFLQHCLTTSLFLGNSPTLQLVIQKTHASEDSDIADPGRQVGVKGRAATVGAPSSLAEPANTA
jgi:hypothetical protein